MVRSVRRGPAEAQRARQQRHHLLQAPSASSEQPPPPKPKAGGATWSQSVVELTNVGRGRLRPYDDHMSEAYADLADATIFVNQGRLVRLQRRLAEEKKGFGHIYGKR